MPIRYRRSSLKSMLGITAEKKRLKRELGITALLRPFRWWGNEKRDVKRELGYYSPEAKLARHVLPHSLSKIGAGILLILGVPFALGYLLSNFQSAQPAAPPVAGAPAGVEVPASTAERTHDGLR